QQIFWNLIKNAVKFTPHHGKLCVRTNNDTAGQFQIEVDDSGCGIDGGTLPKIFHAFEQGGQTQLGGLGLGLAISKALVEAHQGSISAVSEGRDLGAKFTAVFPTCLPAPIQESISQPDSAIKRKSVRLLLVEDHEDTNLSLTRMLRRRGYEVHPAFDVRSAL